MKKIYLFFFLLSFIIMCASCNDEWKKEQFENFISFKAPLTEEGVSDIYVRYRENEKSTYQQALIVSGSLINDKDIVVHVGLDVDTLDVLNYERFQSREDFYYKVLNEEYYSIPSVVNFKAGESTALMNIDFTFKNIDLANKWILPLMILDDPSYNYIVNPRKHYRKALLRVNPFNNYSGTYSGTALKVVMEGYEDETPIVKDEIKAYVVDENTVFFYAGNIDEDRQDRGLYKIYVKFNDNGVVNFYSDNQNIDLMVNKEPSYTVMEQMDAVRPYLLHRYTTINNIDYEFTDYTMVPNYNIRYKVSGSLILQRQLNTQIPDEDQAIEW